MLTTDQSPLLDVAGTRANLHRFVQPAEPAPQNATHPYLDRDTTPRAMARPAQRLSPSAARPVNTTPFEDLDAAPLPLDPQEDVPTIEAPIPAADQPAPTTPTAPTLPAATLRRIILHATTSPGATPAYRRAQANIGGRGLCFGIGRFCQSDGTLGHYLSACHAIDSAAFDDLFGEHAQAVLETTTTQDTDARLAPVGGDLLWSPDWIKRFKAAAKHSPFQDMQFKATSDVVLSPLLPLAAQYNMRSERALAIIVDRAILLGLDATRDLIQGALTPDAPEVQNIATLAGLAAASDLAGRAPMLVAEGGLSDAPLPFGEARA